MIPKIIHLCWLSGDAYPAKIAKCIASWKKFLPDYEIMLWDTNRFDLSSSQWVREAFEHKKYAFAADYIRRLSNIRSMPLRLTISAFMRSITMAVSIWTLM